MFGEKDYEMSSDKKSIAHNDKSKKRPKDICVVVIDGPEIHLECRTHARKTQALVEAVIRVARRK